MNIKYMRINKFKKISVIVLIALVLAGTFTIGFFTGRKGQAAGAFNPKEIAYSAANQVNAADSAQLDPSLYWQVWDALQTDYLNKSQVTDSALFYGSLKGMAEATGDPYTVFMDPSEAEQFVSDLNGTFEGIGAEVGIRNDIITIIAPLDGTPAQKAGLMAGDQIYAIDGQSTAGMSVDEAVKLIRGDKGTSVTLSIVRGQEKPKDYTITRDVIVVKSLTTEMRADGILVIRISGFNNDTEDLFNQAVNLALTKNAKSIILDLRNNPGGYLDTAVAMASEWIPAGPVVAEQLSGNRRNEYPANGRARLEDFPTVVLINGGSASAAEILAGALRDYKKATLVGETTFGKGTVQSLDDFSDGSALKVTVASWLTPAGDYINDKGIKPDVAVNLTADDVNKNLDPQLDEAVKILTTGKK